jgi:hypothetical protein
MRPLDRAELAALPSGEDRPDKLHVRRPRHAGIGSSSSAEIPSLERVLAMGVPLAIHDQAIAPLHNERDRHRDVNVAVLATRTQHIERKCPLAEVKVRLGLDPQPRSPRVLHVSLVEPQPVVAVVHLAPDRREGGTELSRRIKEGEVALHIPRIERLDEAPHPLNVPG